MRTIEANEMNSTSWRKLATDAQSQPVKVTSTDMPEVVIVSAEEYKGFARLQLKTTVDQLSKQAKARGITDEKLKEILADEG